MPLEEFDLFSYSTPKFKIDKPIRLIELFSGIGAQAASLRNLGVEFEHWRAIEIDKYAMASYNAIFGTNFDTQDITTIHASDLAITNTDRYCYILTYSFPCQDLSLAGNQKGMVKGSGTRSGLLWEVERILDECDELPQVLLMENVPNVIGRKNIGDFQLWRRKLETLGYSNFVEIVNSKDHEIPQNRNRAFMFSILGDWHYAFPKKKPLKLKLKDMLEDRVDEKYYVSDKAIRYITKQERIEKKYTQINGDVSVPVTAVGQNNWTGTFISDKQGYIENGTGEHQSNAVYTSEGNARALVATEYKNPLKIIEDKASDGGGVIKSNPQRWPRKFGQTHMGSNKRGFIDKGTGEHQSNQVYSVNGEARTIDANEYKHPMKIELDEE